MVLLILAVIPACKKDAVVPVETIKILKEKEKVTPGTTSVSITGTFSYSGRVDEIHFRYGTNPQLFGSTTAEAELEGNNFAIEVTDLRPGSQYFYRYEIDYGGLSDYLTEIDSFYTKSDSPTVRIVEILDMDSTNYRVKCEVITDGSLPVTQRGICWNTYGDPTLDDNKLMHSEGGLGTYTIRLNNMGYNKLYYIRAFARNATGVGLGEVVELKTAVEATIPSVTTVEINEVSATSAVCLGNVSYDGDAEVTERGACWDTEPDPTVAGEHDNNGTGIGEFTVSMTNLRTSTTYYVRTYAKNKKGIAYGEQLSFTTADGKPVVITGSIMEITATSAKCGGNVTDQGASEVTEKGICWSTSHNPTISDHPVNSGPGMGIFTCQLTGLEPNQTYYIRAYAKNTQGISYGEEVSFVALEGLPEVSTGDITETTPTTATGNGNVTDQGGSAILEKGICWGTNHNPSVSDHPVNCGTGTGFFTWTITRLDPGQTYYVRAYARNEQGISYGEDKEFQTKANKPTVTTDQVSNITQNSATFGGNVTSDGGAPVTERGICWSTSQNPTTSDLHTPSGSGTGSFTVNMNGLEPGTTYYVRAYAINSVGISYGNQVSFSTIAELPTLTTSQVSNITQNTAQGGGNVTNDGGAPVTERGICWSTNHNPTLSNSNASGGSGTGSFTVNMTGLSAGTPYYVRAYAKNSQGTSYGGEVSFTTSQNITAPEVTTLNVTNPTQTTAVGGGNVTNNGGAPVTERGICWSTNHNPTLSNSNASGGSGTGSFTVNMTGLSAGTPYYVRAYAKNSQGTSYGGEVSFTTQQEPSYSITVSASPSNGGSVSGGGNYSNGQSCTVHATANSGYTFTNWKENGTQVSTNADYTFTVTSSRTLVAHFTAQPQAPTGAINGLFSVSATQQVYFSQGNLQYQASSNIWRFAENQWDFVGGTGTPGNVNGSTNNNISSTYNGWIDLFGWGTSNYNHNNGACYQPWSISVNSVDYWAYGMGVWNLYDQSGQADWGYNAISNGGNQEHQWRTLTQEEWNYVLMERNTSSGKRFAKANVAGVNGLILLPNNWNTSTFSLNHTNEPGASFTVNEINASQWSALGSAGAVFLPASGQRSQTNVSNVDLYGYYWSSSHNTNDSAYSLNFSGSLLITNYSSDRYYGRSVRLVQNE